MSERPTPETDAVAYRLMTEAINNNKSREAIVFEFEGFARRLERERDEARELAAEWEAIALREASINGSRIFGEEDAK